ncbi:MAG: TonB-dependent receptor [Bacteroidota bacterium]
MKRMFVAVLFCFSIVSLTAQEQDTLTWSIDIEDVVVTAQYAPTSSKEAVHQVEVIKSESWEARGQNTLSEVLQQQLNMRISPDPILGNGLVMQGLGGQNIQLMIDGVPVVGRLGGNVDMSQINLSQFERVEVVMGSMSAQFGSNAAGGVINLISKKNQLNNWKVEVGGQIENIGINNQYARLGRKIGDFQLDGGVFRYAAELDPIDSLRVRRTVTDADGNTSLERISPWNPKSQWGYDANLSFRPHDSLLIRYGLRSFTETLGIYGDIKRPVFRPYAIDQFFTTDRQDHHVQVEHWLSPKVYWQTAAGWNTFDRYKDTQRLDIEPDTTSLEPGGRDTTRYTGLLARTSWSLIPQGKWGGQLGLEYFRETAAGQRILDTSTMNVEPAMVNMAGWLNIRHQPLERLTIEANLRFGYNSRYNHPLIPTVNLMWKPANNVQWRLSYARGFRAPSIQELFFNFIDVNHFIIGNSKLAAERAHNARIQLAWSSPRSSQFGNLDVSAAFFYNSITNRITLAEFEVGRFTYDNLDVYETHGLNAVISWQPIEEVEWRISGAYTRLYNSFIADFKDTDRFIGLPEMSNQLIFNFADVHTTISLVHRYLGRQDRYTTNSDGDLEQGFVEDYSLLDFTIQQGVWDNRLQIGVGVKNIFDLEQIALVGANGGGGAHSGSSGSRLVNYGRSYFVRLALSL